MAFYNGETLERCSLCGAKFVVRYMRTGALAPAQYPAHQKRDPPLHDTHANLKLLLTTASDTATDFTTWPAASATMCIPAMRGGVRKPEEADYYPDEVIRGKTTK
ncbi:MAG: hypothetical protein FRX49_02802 [Trebouxia sp. A1-2]|nr:MAG: hypothetical protein FRX49_02802 [Trebouxia sp. A1-2]